MTRFILHRCFICLYLALLVTVVVSLGYPLSSRDEQVEREVSRLDLLAWDKFKGSEGSPIKGFVQDKVLAVLTPGVLAVEHAHHVDCSWTKFATTHWSPKVRAFAEVSSLKDVYGPNKIFHDFVRPFSDKVFCEAGHVTPVGLSQMMHLGQHFERAYQGLMGSHSSIEDLRAVTWGHEALVQSLNAFLYGLLGEKQFIRHNMEKAGALFCHHKGMKGSKTSEESSQRGSGCPFDSDVHTLVEKAFHEERDLSTNSESELPVPASPYPAFLQGKSAKESLSVLAHLAHQSPQFVSASVADQHVQDLFGRSDGVNRHLSNHHIFQAYAHSRTIPLLQDVLQWFVSADSPAPKNANNFDVRAVDDLLMLSFLSSLNISPESHLPPASRLVIERFYEESSRPDSSNLKSLTDTSPSYILSGSTEKAKSDTSLNFVSEDKVGAVHTEEDFAQIWALSEPARHTLVRVLFNGEVVTSALPGCDQHALASLGLCPLTSLRALAVS